MANTIICSNPMCGKEIRYEPKAFQVICPACNTWHLAPEEDDNSTSNEQAEDDYIPNDFTSTEVPPNEILPDVLETEKQIEVTVPLDALIEPGFIVTDNGERYQLKMGKNFIGRKAPDISLPDKTISRVHCVLEVLQTDEGKLDYCIYDIGHESGEASTNGVFLSGRSQRLQDYEKVPIKENATIKLGNISFQLST